VLVDTTIKVAAGAAVAGPVASLMNGASQAMLWTKGVILAACIAAVGVVGVGGVLGQRSGEPGSAANGQPAKATEPAQPPAKADTPKEAEKTYEMTFRGVPWAKVFEWYAEVSGLPFVGQTTPAGTLTLLPVGQKPRYTLSEVTDLLNEALIGQNRLLVRRDKSFTVLATDERVEPTLVPRVAVDELPKRGRTELVSVAIPLTNLTAGTMAADVKKLLGPFGEVVALEAANLLVVRDTAGNLRLIVTMIKEVEAGKKAEPKK
jgi:hypothetical protein